MNNSIFSPSTPHYVYIVNREDLESNKLVCKIGYTKDANQRVKGLQTGSDKKLRVFKKFLVAHNRYDGNRIEKQIQRMFKQFKREGEWFAFDPIDLINVVLPKIEKFVNDLDVKDEPLPITAIANIIMTKEQDMKCQLRKIALTKKSELTLEEELELTVIKTEIQKNANLRKIVSREKAVANRR